MTKDLHIALYANGCREEFDNDLCGNEVAISTAELIGEELEHGELIKLYSKKHAKNIYVKHA